MTDKFIIYRHDLDKWPKLHHIDTSLENIVNTALTLYNNIIPDDEIGIKLKALESKIQDGYENIAESISANDICLRREHQLQFENMKDRINSNDVVLRRENQLQFENIKWGSIDATVFREGLNALNKKNRMYIQSLDSKINELKQLLHCSSQKGKIGEHMVVEWISTAFPDYSTTLISASSFVADIRMNTDFGDMLVEVKFWNSTIPTKEVNKFKRDLASSLCECGLFISIGQAIVSHRRCMVEKIDNKYILYIPNATRESVVWAIIAMREIKNYITHGDTSDVDSIQKTITLIQKHGQIYLDNFEKQILQLSSHIKRMRTSLGTMDTLLIQLRANAGHNIKNILMRS